MQFPTWLKKLNARDEKTRAAHGLTPKKDGWYKWLEGKVRYVCKPCPVADAVESLARKVKDMAQPAIPPTVRAKPGTLSIEAIVELYLSWLYERLTTGRPKKLKRRTYDDNVNVLDKFVGLVGPAKLADAIGPEDFTAYSRKHFVGRAVTSIRREIIYIEAFANWAAPGSRKAGHLVRPWQFGTDFTKPSDSAIAEAAAEIDKAYSADDIRTAFLRVKESHLMRAAGWLGLNCAFGPKDIGELPESAVDLEAGIIKFKRGKTGAERLCVLWPWTVIAMKKYLSQRPDACHESAAGMFFRTSNGLPYARSRATEGKETEAASWHDGIGNRWHKLTGLPFSGWRATFATLADDWPDQRAIDLVMGHKRRDIREAHYAKNFEPDRIRKLVAHVWGKARKPSRK